MRTKLVGFVFAFLISVVALGQQPALVDLARAQQEYVTNMRHEFHSMPELRWKEYRTLESILEEVGRVRNISVNDPSIRPANYDVDPKLDRILFRADVDGLPVQEETGLPYASKTPGLSHACGHDTHIAMMLGFVKTLVDGNVRPKHNLRIVFQRAEENPIDKSGGASLVEEGVLDGVSAVYGLHIWANGKPGEFLSRPGPLMANSDRIHMVIRCTGGHVAMPHRGSNAIDIATDIHVALRGFDRRLLGAVEPCSLVPAVSNAGTASNVRPSQADIWYAARNFLNEVRRTEFAIAVQKRVEGVVGNYPDARLERYDYVKGHPATINTPDSVEKVGAALRAAGQTVAMCEPELGGDDFAHYVQRRPGSYWLLGARKQVAGDHHSPTFDVDESVLWRGVLFWLVLATN